jgi:D-arabinose 1-dehydrogenase-like Zn-dependent alcohol dehydrogenase
MLDFARKHNVTAMIEKIPMPYINTAMERSEESNVKYCFVVEIANTPG